MKAFKKKRYHKNIIYIGIFLMSISFSIRYLYKNNLVKDDTIVDILINDSLGIYDNNIDDASFILKYAFNVNLKEDNYIEEKKEVKVIKEDSELPTVYIYNTHTEEKYKNTYLYDYNITPSVKIASKVLKEYLKEYNIFSITEEDNVVDKLNSLNWNYGKSYAVSRMLMEEAFSNNPTLKYFIDIHRDSSSYDSTTIEIDGKKYARLLFVVGLDHESYELNLKLVERLQKKLDDYYPGLCRGIMKKSGKGVNGIYNQDYNSNVMLIEVGGQYNDINEVNNTLKVLAKYLSELFGEDGYGQEKE